MPLYEPHGVSFDEYLQDRARVFRAMFPDESRSQQLSDVTNHLARARAHSVPRLRPANQSVGQLTVLDSARGVEDPDAAAAVPPPHRAPRRRHAAAPPRRRPRAPCRAYSLISLPTHVQAGASDDRRRVCVWLWLQTEWELRGLDSGYAPASFDLGVRGSLFADRSRSHRAGSRMRGHLEIAITCVLPPPLRLVPEGVLRGVAESVLTRLAEKMKRDVDVGLVADFQMYRREKAAASGATARLVDATASERDEA
uniref:Uncharacterized protein n=1 Tax=Arundo donax TaxID=35708 RepID=A0A0A9DMT3_ARUDO